MYVPKQLKLNKFSVVNIPSAKEIFTRFGYCTGSSFTGDDVVPTSFNKVDMMIHFDLLNENKLNEESVKLDPTK